MLRAEVLVVEPLGLLAGQVHDLLGAVGETIEHAAGVVAPGGAGRPGPWGAARSRPPERRVSARARFSAGRVRERDGPLWVLFFGLQGPGVDAPSRGVGLGLPKGPPHGPLRPSPGAAAPRRGWRCGRTDGVATAPAQQMMPFGPATKGAAPRAPRPGQERGRWAGRPGCASLRAPGQGQGSGGQGPRRSLAVLRLEPLLSWRSSSGAPRRARSPPDRPRGRARPAPRCGGAAAPSPGTVRGAGPCGWRRRACARETEVVAEGLAAVAAAEPPLAPDLLLGGPAGGAPPHVLRRLLLALEGGQLEQSDLVHGLALDGGARQLHAPGAGLAEVVLLDLVPGLRPEERVDLVDVDGGVRLGTAGRSSVERPAPPLRHRRLPPGHRGSDRRGPRFGSSLRRVAHALIAPIPHRRLPRRSPGTEPPKARARLGWRSRRRRTRGSQRAGFPLRESGPTAAASADAARGCRPPAPRPGGGLGEGASRGPERDQGPATRTREAAGRLQAGAQLGLAAGHEDAVLTVDVSIAARVESGVVDTPLSTTWISALVAAGAHHSIRWARPIRIAARAPEGRGPPRRRPRGPPRGCAAGRHPGRRATRRRRAGGRPRRRSGPLQNPGGEVAARTGQTRAPVRPRTSSASSPSGTTTRPPGRTRSTSRSLASR